MIIHKDIKISAKLNIEKYLIHIKSITFPLKTLSYQFQIAQAKTNTNEVSSKSSFFFFSSVK
jgi:hypothetical protein